MSGGLRMALDATEIESNKNNLIIYPNPVINGKYIFLKYRASLKDLHLEVFDLSGKKIIVDILEDKIDVSELSDGIYILKESVEGVTTSSKFIISR